MTTSTCWSVLDLDHDADERSIKRQYARLLKTTRPDDDPAAFQTLRDAYEQALDWARNRPQSDAEQSGAEFFEEPVTSRPFADEPVLAVDTPVERMVPVPEHNVPLVRPSVELSWYEQASLTTPDNLAAQRQIAHGQGCDEEFQQQLARRCLLDPEEHLLLIKAAVAQLRWLTPWQKVHFRPHQVQRLTQALLDSSLPCLRALLAAHQEREFLDALKALEQQPWLSSLDQHDQLEHWTMTLLLNNDDWSAALFERVSALFDWDSKHDVHSGTPSLWMHLIERCERKEFVRHQRQLLQSPLDNAPAYAARLILEPPPLKERLRIARESDDSVLEACERLSFDLQHRFPDLMEQFPNADPESWRKLRKQVDYNPKIRVYLFGVALTLAMLFSPSRQNPAGWGDVMVWAITLPLILLWGFYIAKTIWTKACDQVRPLDTWLSERLMPDFLSWPGYRALPIRHGVPVLAIGSIYAQNQPLALAAYGMAMVIWIYLSPYRLSLVRDAIVAKTGGWQSVKDYCARNTGRWVMIVMGLMLTFVIAVILMGPGPRH
ncbi:J domain-containing protein [Pseudomonas floridensis]